MASKIFSTNNKAVISTVNFQPVAFIEDVEPLYNVLEISFARQKVYSNRESYSCLIDSIPLHQLTVVRHIILLSPSMGRYEALNRYACLKQYFRYGKTTKADAGLAMSDGKPSSLLQQMQQLVRTQNVCQKLFKDMRVQRIPNMAQTILASLQSENIDDLATIADGKVKKLPAQVYFKIRRRQPELHLNAPTPVRKPESIQQKSN